MRTITQRSYDLTQKDPPVHGQLADIGSLTLMECHAP